VVHLNRYHRSSRSRKESRYATAWLAASASLKINAASSFMALTHNAVLRGGEGGGNFLTKLTHDAGAFKSEARLGPATGDLVAQTVPASHDASRPLLELSLFRGNHVKSGISDRPHQAAPLPLQTGHLR
jgi:hypothetical protein